MTTVRLDENGRVLRILSAVGRSGVPIRRSLRLWRGERSRGRGEGGVEWRRVGAYVRGAEG
jgi:hypothetical protein